MRDLSPEQRRTLTVVACLTLLHERMPTLQEIARALGCSRPAVHYRLFYLEKKGLWSAKSWGITDAGLLETHTAVSRALAELRRLERGPARSGREKRLRPRQRTPQRAAPSR